MQIFKIVALLLLASLSLQFDENKIRPACSGETQCHNKYPMYFCEENICDRQTFYFYPLETIGLCLVFMCLILSSAVGLGSTTINVGMSFLLLQLRHPDAYPLVSVAVFSSSMIHFMLSFVVRSK